MSSTVNRYDEPQEVSEDRETARVVEALDRLYTAPALSPDARASLRQAMQEHAHAIRHAHADQGPANDGQVHAQAMQVHANAGQRQAIAWALTRRRRIIRWWPRVIALAALFVAALGGALYESAQTPAVSAQAILDRAVQVQMAPRNTVIHQTFVLRETIHYSGGATADVCVSPAVRIADSWTQVDARGDIVRNDGYTHSTAGVLLYRELDGGGVLTVIARPCGRGRLWTIVNKQRVPLHPDALSTGADWWKPLNVQRVLEARAGTKRLLPQQTLGGRTMDVIQIRSSTAGFDQVTTLYIDARTYRLRKVSLSATYQQKPAINPRAVVSEQASAELVGYEQMAPSAVPSFVFNMRVDPPFRVPGRHT